MKSTIKIDAGVVDRALIFIRSARKAVNPRADANARVITLALDEALTILSTAQPQPEVTDAESLYSITKKQRSALVRALEEIDCDCSRFQCYRCDALAIVRSTIPHQPDEVTDAGRKAALNDFDGAVGTATTDYASRDITHEMYPLDAVTVETIRAALSAPAVQDVTVHDLPADENNAVFTDIAMRERKWIEKYFTNNNLRIVRGEGEKS